MSMELEYDMTEQLLPSLSTKQSPEIVKKGTDKPLPPSYGNNTRLHLCALLISLSSLLWGFSLSALNVCIVPDAIGSLLIEINMSTEEQETATALVLVGALFSALTTSGISQRIGQKQAIIWNNGLYIAGSILCALAMSKRTIYLSRLLFGIACGVVTNNVPILLNEISPVSCRGQITTYFQLGITIGMLISAILGFILVDHVPSGWRYLNGLILVPALIQIMLVRWMPASPWWNMQHKGREECLAVLKFLRKPATLDMIEIEMNEIAQAVEARKHEKQVGWRDLWQYKRCITMGVFLVFFQAMTGINTVMLYSAKIFHFAGVENPFLATTIVSVVNVSMTIVSVKMVDKYGRRPLLLFGVSVMICALFSLSSSLLFLNDSISTQAAIAVISMLTFVGAFGLSLGAVVWVVLADITPVHIRPRAFSIYMSITYVCNILIATYTLSAINALGKHHQNPEKNGIAKLYFILSGVAIACLFFVLCVLPETKQGQDSTALEVKNDIEKEKKTLLAVADESDNSDEMEDIVGGPTTEL